MSWFITNSIAAFLLPPLSLLCLLALGIFLLDRHKKLGKKLMIAAFCLLWIASTPYFAEGALHLLEAQTAPLDIGRPQTADAIVILGEGPISARRNMPDRTPSLKLLWFACATERNSSGKPANRYW